MITGFPISVKILNQVCMFCMKAEMINRELIMANSVLYSERFGFDLAGDPFPWFLLSVLFGARITESIAVRTFFLFKSEGLTTPESITNAGFDRIVSILDSGGYTRYDFKTAAKLDELSKSIISRGGLTSIHEDVSGMGDLVAQLKGLAKGIGDVTVGIFLREMVGVWEKAEPYPSELVRKGAEYLGIDACKGHREFGVSYGRFESFLLKVARKCLRKKSSKNRGFCDLIKEQAA